MTSCTPTLKSGPSGLVSFIRSHVSGGVATVADFGLLFLLTEGFGVWYVTATVLGAILGGIVNFLINRYWSFEASHWEWQGQAWRYATVSFGSLALNAGGAWVFTEKFHIPYGVSVLAASFFVATLFNYPLHRFFVYNAPVH